MGTLQADVRYGQPVLIQKPVLHVQVDSDVAVLQGSMRFLGSLFKEHLLPYALLRTLVGDLVSHSEKARPSHMHALPLQCSGNSLCSHQWHCC